MSSSKEARALRLQKVRKLVGSRRAFSDLSGQKLKPSTIQSWETPKLGTDEKLGGLTAKGARRVIEVLDKVGIKDCTFNWLYHGIGESPKIGLGFDAQSEDNASNGEVESLSEDDAVVKELLTFRQNNPSVIDYFVSDDGMSPHYVVGDCVAGKRRTKAEEIDKLLGKNCIVETQKNEVLLRRLLKGKEKGMYTLSCTNLDTSVRDLVAYDEQITSAAPVVWHRRKDSE